LAVRWLAGLFLVAHGLVHVAIWSAPRSEDAPFDASHSPLFGDVRVVAAVGAVVAGAAFVVSGIAYLTAQDWWAAWALAAAGISLVLLVVTFTPWWLLAMLIDVGIAVLAWRAWRA
jgi:hypothetical protein